MNDIFISYLVTCKNEGKQLETLLNLLGKYKEVSECVVLDDYSDDEYTVKLLKSLSTDDFFKVARHNLDNDYGEHKNYGKFLCKGKWIFQIDADEIPATTLMENLKSILESNDAVDLIWLPRINIFTGVTDAHARQWGWDINNEHRWVNWTGGDFQGRLIKNIDRLMWDRPLHEKIVGYKTSTRFPREEDFALIHTKTIEKQEETNQRYNRDFSEALNKGFIV